jgi:hypothetical protein
MLVEVSGSGPRVVLVHGSAFAAAASWRRQRELAARFTLVLVTRPGFPPGPPVERVDFEVDSGLLGEVVGSGDHLVDASYGGVVSLLHAATREDLGSLTVLEPPAFGLVRDRPDLAPYVEVVAGLYASAPQEPRSFLARFFELAGVDAAVPDPLPPDLEQGARMLMVERGPWEADIPLDRLASTPYPKLAASGAHDVGFDAICRLLADRAGFAYAALPGAGHAVAGAPGFNDLLAGFVDRAAVPVGSDPGTEP